MSVIAGSYEFAEALGECSDLPLDIVFPDGSIHKVGRVIGEDGPNGPVTILELVEDDREPMSAHDVADDIYNHRDLPILVGHQGGRAQVHAPEDGGDVVTVETA